MTRIRKKHAKTAWQTQCLQMSNKKEILGSPSIWIFLKKKPFLQSIYGIESKRMFFFLCINIILPWLNSPEEENIIKWWWTSEEKEMRTSKEERNTRVISCNFFSHVGFSACLSSFSSASYPGSMSVPLTLLLSGWILLSLFSFSSIICGRAVLNLVIIWPRVSSSHCRHNQIIFELFSWVLLVCCVDLLLLQLMCCYIFSTNIKYMWSSSLNNKHTH